VAPLTPEQKAATAAEYMAGIAAEYDAELVAPVLRRLARYQAESGRACERCHERKRISEFSRDSRDPSGRRRYCKPCASAEYRTRVNADSA